MTAPQRWRCLLPLLVPLVLTACGGLLPQAPTRPLYRTNVAASFTARLPHLPAQLVVAVPVAPAGIDSARIALTHSAVSLDYFADAEWTDRAPLLVQTALVDAFEKSGAVNAVGRDGLGLRADFLLETEMRDFQAVYESPSGPPHIAVALTAMLVKLPEHRIVAQISVSRQTAAAANDVPAVVGAFNAALGGAVEEVVIRTVTNPALSAGRQSVHFRTRFVRAP